MSSEHEERPPWVDDFDDDGAEEERCSCCGGEGFVEYIDNPEVWGEDFPSLANHSVTCPECQGSGDLT